MRLISVLLVGVALLVGQEAHAQFSNHSIGLSTGFMKMNSFDGLDWAVPVGLEGSVYIENGFDLIFHGYAMVLQDRILQQQFMGFFASGGARYLFSQEAFRPYVGLELAYFQTFGTPSAVNRVGICPELGADYFITDNTSLGLRAQFVTYWMLNSPVTTSLSGNFMVAVWF